MNIDRNLAPFLKTLMSVRRWPNLEATRAREKNGLVMLQTVTEWNFQQHTCSTTKFLPEALHFILARSHNWYFFLTLYATMEQTSIFQLLKHF